MFQTGLLIAGVNGAVGSTVKAGCNLLGKNAASDAGLLTERTRDDSPRLSEVLNLPSIDEIHVDGWDVSSRSLEHALSEHQVLRTSHIKELDKEIRSFVPHPFPDGQSSEQGQFGPTVQAIRNDIRNLKEQHNLQHVIVVNLLPTTKNFQEPGIYQDEERFKAACKADDECITPSIKYAVAAVKENCAFLNYTPNKAAVPVIMDMANRENVPVAGKDGKTGQTFLKTALAPAFETRNLQIEGWFSTNILGNNDGKNLSDPENKSSKIQTKAQCLDSIAGYDVANHQVHIHNYTPRQDDKEAWDNIDIKGFLDYRMQIKVNFLAKDSILAAPTVIDMARLLTLSLDNEEGGPQSQFSMFFKQPQVPRGEPVYHDLFKQRSLLVDWINSHVVENDYKI